MVAVRSERVLASEVVHLDHDRQADKLTDFVMHLKRLPPFVSVVLLTSNG